MNTFKGLKITLMGLGINGGAVEDAIFFMRQGAHLTITDLKNKKELASSLQQLKQYKGMRYVLGRHRKEDFINADLIIKNPGVPNNSIYLQNAKKYGVPIETSIGIFSELADMSRIIGVTGTKGKSSTTALVHAVLKLKYPNAYIGGNIGLSPLRFLENNKKGEWGVLELSSWQLEGMAYHKKSPHIAIITNIAQDHLNRYKNFRSYIEAKKHIFRYQHEGDILLANKNDKKTHSFTKEARSRIIFFSSKDAPALGHNPANVAVALAIAKILRINKTKAEKTIQEFNGLEGRLQKIAVIRGTIVYNDTAATNPYAAENSLAYFKDNKVALIVGGEDKKLNYKTLAKILPNLYKVILLPGSASDKIKENYRKLPKNFIEVKTLKKAAKEGLASKAEVLLFSPAAASFNMFQNEFDRGRQFNEIIKNYQNEQNNPR